MTDDKLRAALPRTDAGRRLLEREAYNSRSFAIIRAEDIIAIEDEAAALAASATDEPSLDVERLTVALHGGDCVPNGLGLHIAGSEGAYCTLIAPAVARAYSVKAASATDEQTDPKG